MRRSYRNRPAKGQPRIHPCSIPPAYQAPVAAVLDADRRRFADDPSLLEFVRPAVTWELPALRPGRTDGVKVRVTQVRPGVRVRSVVNPAGDAAHRHHLLALSGVYAPGPERSSTRIFRRWKAARL